MEQPLVTNRLCLVWLRICSPDESTTRRQKLMHTTFSTIVLTALICAIAACLVFCWKFIAIDVGRSVFAIMCAIIGFSAVYMATVGIISLRHKFDAIFENLSTIYKDSKRSIFVLQKISLQKLT